MKQRGVAGRPSAARRGKPAPCSLAERNDLRTGENRTDGEIWCLFHRSKRTQIRRRSVGPERVVWPHSESFLPSVGSCSPEWIQDGRGHGNSTKRTHLGWPSVRRPQTPKRGLPLSPNPACSDQIA